MRLAAQQVMGRHHESGRAEPTLDGARLDEGVLNRVKSATAGQAFDRDDLPTLDLAREHEAGADQRSVEVHGARSALALLAGILRAEQAKALAQHVQEALALPGVLGDTRLSVD